MIDIFERNGTMLQEEYSAEALKLEHIN